MRFAGAPLLLAAVALAGCSYRPPATPSPAASVSLSAERGAESRSVQFASVASKAGIDFRLGHGGRTPLNILETSGGGCAFLDFDTDGWPDVLLVGPHNVALYRNKGDGTFANVTAGSGLDPKRYWMGCAVGDYDGDGLPDIFLTGYRCHALYRNQGDGRFQDETARSGIGGLDWCLSAAFTDLNGDGRLDLFVSQYLRFAPPHTPNICVVGRVRSACGPEVYRPLSGRLFYNQNGRRFAPAAWKDTGKTWGVVASDLLGTGRPALYLANDMMPGDLWTRESGKWRNVGPASGTAYDAQGHLQGGMGVDSGDYDNDGRLDLIVTTYFAQAASLYHNDGNGLFTVTSGPSGLGPPTMPYVGFGTGFADFDNDGWQDLIITNGHVRDNVHDFDASQSYAQPIQVFRNERGRFVDISGTLGAVAGERAVGRGLAFADYDRDGRIDVLIGNLDGPALLLRNQAPASRHWLAVRLRSPGANRSALGAFLTLKAGGQTQVREIRTCGSVLSAHDSIAHFGLGSHQGAVELQIRWPDGTRQSVPVPKTNTLLTVSQRQDVARADPAR